MWTGITLFYFACLAFGFLVALLSAVFGQIGAHVHIGAGGHDFHVGHGDIGGHGVGVGHGEIGGHGVGVGHGEIGHGIGGGHEAGVPHGHAVAPGSGESQYGSDVSILNGLTVATFTGCFGASGLMGVWVLGLGPVVSLVFAVPSGMVLAVLQFLIFVRIFIRSQASSEATMFEVLGCEAEVTASIPGDRMGQIAYVIKGSRYTAPAVSADGQDIARGARVQVVNIRGNALVVRPA